jgi:hypothetical protein
MFGFNKLKDLRTESESSNKYEIDLNVLFYVIKYADEINLEVISDKEIYKNGVFLSALDRTLKLDRFLINIYFNGDWTISITLINKNKSLTVAEMQIPYSIINWHSDENFVSNRSTLENDDVWDNDNKYASNYSTLKWNDNGSWCKIIYEKVNSLRDEIENKKKEKELEKIKEKNIEEQERNKDKLYFENVFKMK